MAEHHIGWQVRRVGWKNCIYLADVLIDKNEILAARRLHFDGSASGELLNGWWDYLFEVVPPALSLPILELPTGVVLRHME